MSLPPQVLRQGHVPLQTPADPKATEIVTGYRQVASREDSWVLGAALTSTNALLREFWRASQRWMRAAAVRRRCGLIVPFVGANGANETLERQIVGAAGDKDERNVALHRRVDQRPC